MSSSNTAPEGSRRRDDDEDEGGEGDGEDDLEEWEPSGEDVYADLDRLERAIALSNADENLAEWERRENLDYIAEHRRPLLHDVVRYAVPAALVSFTLTALYKIFRSIPPLNKVVQRLVIIGNVHFWSVIVASPLLLLAFPSLLGTNSPSRQEEESEDDYDVVKEIFLMRRIFGPDYYPFVFEYRDSRTSCDDYVRCLMEQWASAVAGVALVAAAAVVCATSRLAWQTTSKLHFPSCWPWLELLTRLGAYASLRQYPKLWFQLTRSGQPRPLARSVWLLQSLSAAQLFPWSLVPSFAECLSSLSWTMIGCVYAGIVASLATVCLSPSLLSGKRRCLRRRAKILLSTAAITWTAYRTCPAVLRGSRTIIEAVQRGNVRSLLHPRSVWANHLLNALAVCVASMGPLVHVAAWRRLVRVSRTHDLSLGLGTDDFLRRLRQEQQDDSLQQRRTKWRWRLAWREPQRIWFVLRMAMQDLWYWYFYSGSIDDQLLSDFRYQHRFGTAHAEGVSVLQRMARAQAYAPDAPRPDRTKWKPRAMEKVAAVHKNNYERKTFVVSGSFFFFCL